MARSKSSARWLREHFSDEYVKRARQDGYRSRAVYKLKEIQDKDRIIRAGMNIVDLGAAPGGWSQFAARIVGKTGNVFALDILPMDSLPNVTFVKGDFREQEIYEQLLSLLDGQSIDLVISDIAPNKSGIKAVDQPRGMYLTELALDFAKQCLKPGGDFLTKAFQGEGFDALMREIRTSFASVASRKPKSSRSRSPELYLLARNYHL